MEFIAEYTPDDAIYHHNHPITEEFISSYLEQEAIQLNGNFEHDLEMILLQKYLGSFLQHPENDCYYDNRRTGYPVLPINPESNMNLGLIALTKGDQAKAQQLFGNAAGVAELSEALGVLYLEQGEWAKAANSIGSVKSNNAALAQILT